MVKPELGFIWSVVIRVKRMVVDQIDTDGGRGLRLCSVPPTRCNRLPLGHRTRREPEVALLELASQHLLMQLGGPATRTKAATLRQTIQWLRGR